MRTLDWERTPLGSPETWSLQLRTYVELILASKQAMYLGWTHQLIALYNDAYRPILGVDKHPGALGTPTAEIFKHDGYPGIKPYFDAVLERGESIVFVDLLVPLIRHGYLEECYFDASYTPVRGPYQVEGMLATVNETTERVLGARRTQTLARLTARLLSLETAAQVTAAVMQSADDNPADLPFILLALPTRDGALQWSSSAGLNETEVEVLSALFEPWTSGDQTQVLTTSAVTVEPWPEPVIHTAVLPLHHPDQTTPLGFLVIGLNARKRLDDPYRDFLQVLGSQVAGALRTAQLTARLREQHAELEARTKMLEAFSELTQDLSVQGDPLQLIRQTQEVVLPLLSPGFSQYYEPQDGLWVIKSQVGQTNTPELQAQVGAGLAFDSTPNLLIPWHSGEAYYQDQYDHGADQLTGSQSYPGATVTLPLSVGGQPRGILGFALFHEQQWSRTDRALLETVMSSLNLALERAEQARTLQTQRIEVESRNAALEAFAQLSRDLVSETDRHTLIQRAQEIVLPLLPPGYAVYYELEGGRWRMKSQVGDLGSPALQALVDAGFSPDVPTLSVPFTTQQPFYQDVYPQGADTPVEAVEHIQAVTTLPVLLHGVPVGLFLIGLFDQHTWTPVDKAVLETTLRSLTLALERAEHTRQLTVQRDTLDARTLALSDANEELEAFAYSVSHDLRTPVRHIAGFSTLLRTSLQDQLTDRSARYLSVIDQAAQRMNSLIDAMLDLSRTSQQPLSLRLVDLDQLVMEIQTELELDLSARAITWQVGPLPRVMGDQELLRQVMVNLLSNALKYSRQQSETVIDVWAEDQPETWTVFVRDNGVGFDPRYADKLFGIFQRLHRQEDFEGTGVGLANIRRIIARHGGTVFARGTVGGGATFGFALPKPL
ncbi:ATP-binding protein [Deinococcus sp. QL22]|uniref:ATP-binding protein n=1 Tax=Deinococcus sp. QL22 TaxID=2939437 RepID=UPI002017153A|nr:ATP-binding protein [Deinococcus sp. QL22]UQN09345.1 ATP-binding protein [Deinococcus sp. QL22]